MKRRAKKTSWHRQKLWTFASANNFAKCNLLLKREVIQKAPLHGIEE
jgi:hypothetical protein